MAKAKMIKEPSHHYAKGMPVKAKNALKFRAPSQLVAEIDIIHE